MPPTDEYGIEYDADVEQALKDPKAGLLDKVLDYRERRQAAKKKVEEDKAEKEKKQVGIFGGIFS